MRRIDSAAGQNYFACRAGLFGFAVPQKREADRAAIFNQHAHSVSLGDDFQIGAMQSRPQIRIGRAVALAVFLGDFVKPDAILCGAVEIRIFREADFFCAGQEGAGQGIDQLEIGDV